MYENRKGLKLKTVRISLTEEEDAKLRDIANKALRSKSQFMTKLFLDYVKKVEVEKEVENV